MKLSILYYSMHLLLTSANSGLFPKGPVEVRINKIEHCPCDEEEIKLYITRKKINRHTIGFDGNLTLPYQLDRNATFTVSAERWSDGGWKQNAFRLQRNNPCFYLNTYLGEVWYKIQEKAKSVRGICPIPAGFYEVKDYVVDWNDMTIKPFLVGRLRAIFEVIRFGRKVMCMAIEGEHVEKVDFQ